mgnify:CR=1 FL=1
MNSVSVLVEAKKEYTNQLQQVLTPRLYEGFKSIYEDIINILSDEVMEKQIQNASIIKTFQKSLKDIPVWNSEMIKNEYGRIEKASNCDYLENLIEAVFISNTKILTSVQINSDTSINIRINVPQPQHFIHKCYIECSKEIYKNPYIFDNSKTLTPKEKHTNLRETISLINHSITNAVRDLLPIRDILKQGLINKSYENNEPVQRNERLIEEENNLVQDNEDDVQDESENEESDNEEENQNMNEDDNEEEVNDEEINDNDENKEEEDNMESIFDKKEDENQIEDNNNEFEINEIKLNNNEDESNNDIIKIEDNQNLESNQNADEIIIENNEESKNAIDFFNNNENLNSESNSNMEDNSNNNDNFKENEDHIKNIELNIKSNNERKFL